MLKLVEKPGNENAEKIGTFHNAVAMFFFKLKLTVLSECD